MRRLLNTLYINTENAMASLDNENVVISVNHEILGRVPLITLESIICFSYVGASPALIGECVRRGINVSFFSPWGKFLYRASGITTGNIYLRKQQYRVSDNQELSCLVARNMILGKVYNCKWVINRYMRDHKLRLDENICKNVVSSLSANMDKIRGETSLDSLRGLEGECASSYFSVLNQFILKQKQFFFFHNRNRRPPEDNVNAMLSFGYSILTNECAGALEGVGLDSFSGFMHRDRPGRKSLALDLIEELRPIMVDRFVISLINTQQIGKEHFVKTESGAVEMTEDGRKRFLTAWQERKKEMMTHPYLKEKIVWGLVPHVQSLLLARYLRGDIDEYPPLLWK